MLFYSAAYPPELVSKLIHARMRKDWTDLLFSIAVGLCERAHFFRESVDDARDRLLMSLDGADMAFGALFVVEVFV